MSLTDVQLSKSGSWRGAVASAVRDQLRIIDEKCRTSDRVWGRNIVTYQLPTTFMFPGLTKENAQRLVYASLLKALSERFNEVKIVLDDRGSTLYLAYNVDFTDEEVTAMNLLIKECRIDRKDVAAFIRGPGTPNAGRPTEEKKTATISSRVPAWAAGSGGTLPPVPQGVIPNPTRTSTDHNMR